MDGGSNERVLKAPDEGILKGHIKQYIFLLVDNRATNFCYELDQGSGQII